MTSDLYKILERARWAPSGDNCQPWRFEFLDEDKIRIHLLFDRGNVYEGSSGIPTWVAAGALIENIRLASGLLKKKVFIDRVGDFVDGKGFVDIRFEESEMVYDPIEKFIESRTVLRFPYQLTDLSDNVILSLQRSVGEDFVLDWSISFWERLKISRLNMMSSKIRLTMPEAYKVHVKIVDWDHKFSIDKLPAGSLGMGKVSLIFTKFAFGSWRRIAFLNKYLCGVFLPQIELDFIPGIFCARHFRMYFKSSDRIWTAQDYIRAGSAIQRFWLTASSHGLSLQPSFSPIIFEKYVKQKHEFSVSKSSVSAAKRMAKFMSRISRHPLGNQVFQGRLGYSNRNENVTGRSVRIPLDALLMSLSK